MPNLGRYTYLVHVVRLGSKSKKKKIQKKKKEKKKLFKWRSPTLLLPAAVVGQCTDVFCYCVATGVYIKTGHENLAQLCPI